MDQSIKPTFIVVFILAFFAHGLRSQGVQINAFSNPPSSAPFSLDSPKAVAAQLTGNNPNRKITIADVPCGVPRSGSDDPFRLIDANFNPRGNSDIPFLGRVILRLINGSAAETKTGQDMRMQSGQSCWHAKILRDGKVICGGSVIGSHTVLTASSCVMDLSNGQRIFDAKRFQIVLGSVQLSDGLDQDSPDLCVQHFQAALVTSHGSFDPVTNENDIALIQLDRDIDFTKPCICPICLSSEFPDFTEVCVVTGYALNREENIGKNSGSLEMSHISVLFTRVEDPRCGIRTDGKNALSVNNLLCGEILPEEAACQGDTGSGIICLDAETRSHYQSGIVSYGFGCKTGSSMGGIGTRLQPYLQWVEEFSKGDARILPPPQNMAG